MVQNVQKVFRSDHKVVADSPVHLEGYHCGGDVLPVSHLVSLFSQPGPSSLTSGQAAFVKITPLPT